MRKNKRSDLLMDAIGSIDDRFIFEAQVAQPKKRYAPLIKILAIAACTILTMTLMSSLFIGLLAQSNKTSEPESSGQEQTDSIGTGNAPDKEHMSDSFTKTDSNFADALIELKSATQSYASPLEREMLFEGETLLIWQYEDESDYRVCKLGANDTKKIKNALRTRKGFTKVDANTDLGELEGFWICFGDGLVYSPYLEDSAGNVGYGQLFDYDPELEPSRHFIELITNAIENAN